MSQEQHNTHLSLAVLISILALVAGFIWDRVHLEAVDQRNLDRVEELEKQYDGEHRELEEERQNRRQDVQSIRDREQSYENRVTHLEDEIGITPLRKR